MKLNIHKRTAVRLEEDKNQFVRLHPFTARRLFHEAKSTYQHTSHGESVERNGWDLLRDSNGDDVEFLPLRIDVLKVNTKERQCVFCSYNGGMCDVGKNQPPTVWTWSIFILSRLN